MTWAILSMISARFPPVSRWMRIAVTKTRASRLSTRRVIPVRASRKGTPRFCSSKTCRNSDPSGCGISWATSWMAPVKECPARRERAQEKRKDEGPVEKQADECADGEEREGEEDEDAHLHLHPGLPEPRVHALRHLQAGERPLEKRDVAQQFLPQAVRGVGP